MTKILFVCLGNICRSPMAEYIMKDMVKKAGRLSEFYIRSAATSCEEIGNPVHHGTKAVLRRLGIPCSEKRAVQITRQDYDTYDYIIGMDQGNLRDMKRFFGGDPDHKLHLLLDFADGGDIADPWYTGNFEETYRDIVKGCTGLLNAFPDEK